MLVSQTISFFWTIIETNINRHLPSQYFNLKDLTFDVQHFSYNLIIDVVMVSERLRERDNSLSIDNYDVSLLNNRYSTGCWIM